MRNRQKKTQAIGRGEWLQTRWCRSQGQAGENPKETTGDARQSRAGQGRAGAAGRHHGLAVTCKPNSDSRAGVSSSGEQKADCKAERCCAEHTQPGLLEWQPVEVDRHSVMESRAVGTGTWLHARWGIVAPRTWLERGLEELPAWHPSPLQPPCCRWGN